MSFSLSNKHILVCLHKLLLNGLKSAEFVVLVNACRLPACTTDAQCISTAAVANLGPSV